MAGAHSFALRWLRATLVALVLAGLTFVPAAHAAGPATNISLQLSPTSITADGASTSTATATVTDTTSAGVPGETVTFTSSDPGQSISATTDHGDGTYTATITSSTTAGTATITASDTSTPGITPAQQTLAQTAGPATSISLALTPSTITADGSSTSTAKATVADAHGNPVSTDTVGFSSNNPGESISGVTNLGNGAYSATITASHTPGNWTITATDSTAGISTSKTLTEVVGAPAHIALSLQPSTITADGSSTSTATATVTDGSGNPVTGEAVTFSSTDPSQTISATTDHGDGTYTATITSSTTVGTAKIRAHDGALTSTAQTLNQVPGPPANISLTLQPTTITADGTSHSIATATVTDSLGHPLSGQPVSFASTDPGETISGVTPHPNGTYTATITSSTTAGQASITASVAGITSSAQTLTQDPGPAAIIALTVQPPVVAADGSSASTATATVTDAHGNAVSTDTIKFSSSNPGDRIFPQQTPPGSNVYTATIISSTHPGTSTITAKDTNTGASNSQPLKEVVGTSVTNLVSSPGSPVSTNQSVALLATVSGSGGSPSGTVKFTAAGAPIAGCSSVPVSPSSTLAVCQASFAASQSPVQLIATFTPDIASTVAGSTTNSMLAIGAGSTSTTLGASSPTATIGSQETYTAFVSPVSRGPASPTGSVTFNDGGQPIPGCTSVPLQASSGGLAASCSATYQRLGARSVTATYGGDQNFTGSSSGATPVLVQPLGVISSSMQWTWGLVTHSYTTIAAMSVSGLTLGTKVIITCHGHGCPFARSAVTLSGGTRCTPSRKHHCGRHSKGPLNLTPPFRRHHLMVGTRITIEILRPGWTGKYYSFLIRPGRVPQVRISCLAPGLSKPGVDC